jgi:hypothetical protein
MESQPSKEPQGQPKRGFWDVIRWILLWGTAVVPFVAGLPDRYAEHVRPSFGFTDIKSSHGNERCAQHWYERSSRQL